jgi:hypothetical protein
VETSLSKTNFKTAKLQKMDKKQKERKRGRQLKKNSDFTYFVLAAQQIKEKNKK